MTKILEEHPLSDLSGLVHFRDIDAACRRRETAYWNNATRNDLSLIVVQYGQWAVTEYGLESLDSVYAIEKARLWEDEDQGGWLEHML